MVATSSNGPLTRHAGPVSLLLTASIGIVIWLVFYPGIMSYDSLLQYNQAENGAYTTWHPPILPMVLRLLMRMGLDIGAMMLVQCLVGILGIRQALLVVIEFMTGQRTARTYWAATGLTMAILSPLTPTTFYLMTFWKDCWTAFLLLWVVALSLKLWLDAPPLTERRFALRLGVLIAVMTLAALPRHNTLIVTPVLGLLLWQLFRRRGIRRPWPAIILPLLMPLAVEAALEFNPRVLKTYPANHVKVMDLLGICVRFPEERVHLPYVCGNMHEGIDLHYRFGDITPIAADHPETINVELLTDELNPELNTEYRRAILRFPLKLLCVKSLAFAQMLAPASAGSSYLHRGTFSDDFDLEMLDVFRPVRDGYARAIETVAEVPWTGWVTWHITWLGANLVLLALATWRYMRWRRPADLFWLLVLLVPVVYTFGFFLASVALYYRYLYPSTLLAQVLVAGSGYAWLTGKPEAGRQDG